MFAYLSLLSAILFSAHLTYSLAATQTKLSNICSATVVETKNDTCPNGSTFNIMSEYEKPASDWRIDFNELRIQGLNTPDQVVDHIRTRSETGSPCLYQRKVEKQVCCKGWTGKSCDEPICTVACVNGQCTAPDTCSCHSGYAGEGCQFSQNDPRLVQCYRKADCSVPSRISNESMSISYCCGDQAGVATVSADGSCKLCSTHDEDIANITAQVHRTLNYATCVLWGRDHIRTFDGFKYDFQGACQYKLTGTNNWEIDVQSDNCDQWTTCKKTLSITLGGFRVIARGKTVSINGVILDSNKGYVNGPLTIERRTEDYTYLRYSDGVRCKWDNEMTIYVTVEQTYMKQVKGLCGTYTNKVEDDLELPDGSLSTSVTNFANEWRTDSGCAASAVPINPCSTPELLSDAEIACRPIRDPFDSFKLCNRVINDTHIFEACKRDHCASAKYGADAQQQAICSAFEAMARDCADNYIHVNWRKSDRCAKTCYNDKIYTECATTCPATCQNHRQDFRDSLDCSKDCAPGCVCPVDTVIDLGRNASCVKSDQCTCYYHGKYYLPRQTIAIDCNECMCNGGTWSCTKKFCSRTCSVIGTNHIQTFDGKNYAIRGSCEYILVQEINSANGLYITMTNDYKSTSNYKELTVKVNQTYVFIKDKSVYINGEVRPTLPFKNDQITVKRETTVFFVLSGRGFQIQFDGIRAYIRLDPLFVNNTRGLCGTYDFNSQNDFLTHISIVETNIKTFVDDYKVDAACATPSQQHPCQQNVANEKQAQNKCAILKSELFAPCSSVVNPSRFIDNCEFDICSDANARFQNIYFCSAVAAYARECYLANVTINWLTDSRIQSACQDAQYGQCTGGAAYRDCAPKCSQTCHQLTTKSQTCYERECIAGCSCPSQTYLDISIQDKPQCVPQSQCSCYDSESNTYVKTGGIVAKSCGNCTCKDGEWDCESQICEKAVACPANQIYSTNASSCPKTCDNMKSWQDCGSAFEGCTCPDGQVLSHDLKTCVVANSCPCRYAGHLYGSNEIIKRGCSECHCSGASWSCIERKCDATCSASGDPHYSTFDGLRYSYQGNCKYILTQTKDKLFRVITENIQCGTSGVTCAKNILIKYNSLTISLIRGREPIVNDVEITDLTLGRRIFGDVALMKSGLFVFVNSSDFTIRWDEKTRIYVTIHGHLKGQMAGLCGDFDGDSSDDLNTANGVPGSISEMAESWKVEQTCVTGPSPVMDSSAPCANYEARKEWAEKECYKIIDKSETNPFLPCIKKLDETVVRSFYIECLYDACHCDTGGDCECLCTSLSAFAEKCQSIDVPVKWRTQDKCPIQCEYGKIYMSCGPICQPTCRDIYLNDNYNCVESGCQEGCFCPEGQVMDETGACVIPPECPCVDQNLAYPAGSKIIRNCDQCECMNGTFHCEKLHGCVPKCSKREFTCNTTGNCIPLEWVCDKTQDCDDGSDEFNCNCTSDDFFCTSGQCIKPSYRCDGLPQCRDGSDELNCNYTVPCTEFLCENKRCIPTSWLCDGVIDCSSDGHDRSDERHCNVTKCDTDSGREFLCNNMPSGKCLPIAQLCDGHDDCGDGSDEINCNCTCSRNGFACKEFCQCIPVNQVCDGTIQCQDGSDEQKCKCNQGEYTCNGGLCINATKLCDGQINCPKGDDEAQPNCNITTTIPPQTSQRSTEKTSTPISPVTTTPFCKTRLCFVLDVERCIPENEICDGEVFCDDGMDEIPSLFPSILKCQATTVAAVTPRTTTPGKECLPPNKYICNLCLEPERFCNGICDCKHDCSDEKNCTTCTLKCKGSDVCILPEQICDKKCDCFETCSDEQDCIMPTPPPCTQFKCDATKRNPIGKCLNLTRVCDGYADCVDKTDEPERLCNYTTTQVTSKPSLTTTTTVPEVCTNASLTYKTFSLNSPLVLSASSPQLPDISQDREISSANPITITGVKVVQITVNFPSPYQVMEVHLKTTKKLQYFFGNTREQHRQINAVIISSPTDKSFEYLLTIISPSTQPTRQLSLAIVTSGITDITSLTITACIGAPGTERTSFPPLGTEETTPGAPGTGETSMGSVGTERTTVGAPGTGRTSVPPLSTERTTEGAAGTERTSVPPLGTEETTPRAPGTGKTSMGSAGTERTTVGAPGTERTSVPPLGTEQTTGGAADTERTSYPPLGTEETTPSAPGTGKTSMGSVGTERTTLGAPGTERTSVSPLGTERTTAGAPGTERTSFPPPGTEETTPGAPGTGKTSMGSVGTQRTTIGAPGTERTSIPPLGTEETTPGAPGTEKTSMGSVGTERTTVGAAGTERTSVPPLGTEGTTPGAAGTGKTSMGSMGTERTTVGAPGTERTSVPPFGTQRTTGGVPGTERTSIPPLGTEETTPSAPGTGKTSIGSVGTERTTVGAPGTERTSVSPLGTERTTEGVAGTERASVPPFGTQRTTEGVAGTERTSTPALGTEEATPSAPGTGKTSMGSVGTERTTVGAPGTERTSFPPLGTERTTEGAPGTERTSVLPVGTERTTPGAPGTGETSMGSVGTERTTVGAPGTGRTSVPPLSTERTTEGAAGTERTSFPPVGSERTTPGAPGTGETSMGSVGTERTTVGAPGTERISTPALGTEATTPSAPGTGKTSMGSVGTERSTVAAPGTERTSFPPLGTEQTTAGARGTEITSVQPLATEITTRGAAGTGSTSVPSIGTERTTPGAPGVESTSTPRLGTEGTTAGTTGQNIITTTPCYSGDIMYHDNIVLSIKQIERNLTMPIFSLRTDTTGVAFPDTQQPTLLVVLNHTLVSQIISISVPNTRGATNVNQIELTFYGTDGQILRNSVGAEWIVETTPGVTTLEQLVPKVSVGAFEIKLINTTDGKSPRSVTLEVIGCIHEYYTTSSIQTISASLFSVTSSSISSTILSSSTSTSAGTCMKVQAMNPQIGVIDDIVIYPLSLNANANDLVPGRNGLSFPETETRPNITILFNRVGTISFVQIPAETQSNVQQILVEFFNPLGQLITSSTSPANLPQLANDLEVNDVLKVVIHLIATSDTKSPKNVTLDVIGCFFEVTPLSTTTISTYTTSQKCLITDGMTDVNILPNENIINSNDVSIGDRIRLTETSPGYTPTLTDDKITIRLTNDKSPIAIGEIIITAQNFLSAILSIKTTDEKIWKPYATLTSTRTTFDNLYATELQFQFTPDTSFIKLGVIGCFPPTVTTISTSTTTQTTTLSSTSTTSVCILSEWGPWSKCSSECQLNRYQSRSRSVLNGTTCRDPLDESRSCDHTPCQQCTMTRENYIQELERAPPSDYLVGYMIDSITAVQTNTPVYIGDILDRNTSIFVDNCTQLMCKSNGLMKVKVPCQSDCKYTSMCHWSKCDALCGQPGNRTRKQSLIIEDSSKLNPLCTREIIETLPCMGDPCPCTKGVNCTCDLTEWSEWSACSLPCGGGQRERTRQYQTDSNDNCTPNNLREIQSCNVECCPVDGKYTPWSEWSSCTVECGSGIRKRQRTCTDPSPSCKGKPCEEHSIDTEVCNTQPCQETCKNDQVYSDCANECDTSCESLTCDNQCQKPDKCAPGCICPDNKVIGPNGQCIYRKDCPCRLSINNTTLVNGESNIRDPCKTYTCKDGCIITKDNKCTLCEWSPWTPFSDCSNTCNGTQSRFRTYDGPNCPDKRTEEEKQPCSSNCTIVCYVKNTDGSVVTYNVGDLIEETRCSRTVCLETGSVETQPIDGTRVDGQWNLWSPWSECSQTCNGTRTRFRLCTSPAPECNGEVCKKLPHTQTDLVKIENNLAVLEEIERDKCNQLCFSTTTPVSTTVTTAHEECFMSNGTNIITLPPQQIIPNPTNSCEICACKHGVVSCSTICSENEQTCSSKQSQDTDNIYTWIPAQPGQCCGTCNKTKVESKCRVKILNDEYIRVDGCVSIIPVGREQCTGGCDSQASNILTIANKIYDMGNSTCKCCAPKETYTQTISMDCKTVGNQGHVVSATYTRIRSCECQACVGKS
ncbi:unnamed protein product [Rotaria sp. Silwood1]|nr:unnamed protein product [Rotaria sp. Silwood1]